MKPRWLLLATVVVLLAAGGLWIRFAHTPFGSRFADETYDAATTAADADDTERAKALFKEACDEGSDEACRAIGRKR